MPFSTDLSFWFSFSLQRQDIRIRGGLVRAIFAFQDDGAGFEDTNGVPLPCWHIQSYHLAIGCELYIVRANPLQLIVELPHQLAPQTHHGLGGLLVAMYR